ncbi:hypothetical protein ACN47E_005433 [Coniothyrium glycines]
MFKPKEREGAASPSPGAFYSPQQMSSYLQDLRNNRPARPTGSRPPPAHFKTWSARSSAQHADASVVSPLQRTFTDPLVEASPRPSTSHEPNSYAQRPSHISIDQVVAAPGRPLVQPPRGRDTSRSSSRSRTPSVQYREREQRQAEQEEARAVRHAMEELGLAQEEKLFNSARDEAVELVWKHCNPHAPENNPNRAYAYPGLARKGSTQRSRSVEPKEQDLQRANSKLRKRHSMGNTASGSRSSSLQSTGHGLGMDESSLETKSNEQSKIAKAISDLPDFKQRRRSSGRRTTSGSLFQNPNDQIYEEPEEEVPLAPAPTPAAAEPPKAEKLPLGMRRNPFTRFQSIKGNPMTRSNTDPIMSTKRFDRYEIQRNPPSQSRNAAYTLNTAVKPAGSKADTENEAEVPMKDGKEIRSEELRAATGFKLKDRSAKLPTPTAVSDAPGRPIVSFKTDWNVVELKEEKSILQDTPKILHEDSSTPSLRPLSKAATAPVVPTINQPSDEVTKQIKPPFASRTLEDKFATANPSPPSRVGRQNKPLINIYEDAPVRPLPTPLASTASVSAGDIPQGTLALRSRTTPAAPVPKTSVSETPSLSRRNPFARSPSVQPPSTKTTPNVPSISTNETPAPRRGEHVNVPSIGVTPPVPSISVSESPALRRGVTAPSIGVTPPIPSISVSNVPASRTGPVNVPSIAITGDIPTISVNESPALMRGRQSNTPSISITPSIPSIDVHVPAVPSVSVNGPSGFGPVASARPLPTPGNHMAKSHSYNGTAAPRTHWTPTTVRTGALCQQCALPIAGRIVSAAGSRFHPECFACYQCGEHLECVAFYPEPSNKHAERVSRIRARLAGHDIPFLPTHPTPETMARLEHDDSTDESPRFYCHLDFHELFSPRCKSCKTPIEGEVIVACGAEWHAGHFFCAQCGDPFTSSTPFVEKEGYAWCVNCHTNRFSTKCKGCKKPVTDTVVKALGAEWHVGCFCCVECSGPFEDGRYFLRGASQDPVCVRCEERRLKA